MFMRNGWVSDAPFTLNGTNISECISYVYLGQELNMMNDLTPELGRRRRAAWGAYKSIEDVAKWTKKARLRAHLFNTTVLPALTYASETWAFRKQEENTVHTVNWDTQNESVSWDSINITDTNTDKPVNVLQAAFVLPNVRTLPLLVVGTMSGAQIFDIRTQKLLQKQNIDIGLVEPEDALPWNSFCRGITCNDNTILVGTSLGHIIQFQCTGETSISSKKCLKEHSGSIADMATCRYDEITCSGDCSGTIIVWSKNIKGVQLKIATQHPITAINVLRKQVIIGTVQGRVLFYSISGGELMAEICAHARSVTCISVAPESAYVLTGSEDGRFIVYKLHTRKPQAYQVEYRFSDELPHCAIMGAQFTNGRGSSIAVACFDRNSIYGYRIVKKVAS